MNKRLHFLFTPWLVVISLAAMIVSPVEARNSAANRSQTTEILLADLPAQGKEVLIQIRQGGPFQYSKDGSVFGNREQLLPKQPRGHYKEFTVRTPGAKNRGARRIVCGGDLRSHATSICFFTSDHYASFKRIKE